VNPRSAFLESSEERGYEDENRSLPIGEPEAGNGTDPG
jgi:hypothetical protein